MALNVPNNQCFLTRPWSMKCSRNIKLIKGITLLFGENPNSNNQIPNYKYQFPLSCFWDVIIDFLKLNWILVVGIWILLERE